MQSTHNPAMRKMRRDGIQSPVCECVRLVAGPWRVCVPLRVGRGPRNKVGDDHLSQMPCEFFHLPPAMSQSVFCRPVADKV
jgi:hypothetical protein